MPLPDFHETSRGTRYARCGACLKTSTEVGGDPEAAWVELQRLGWTWYVSPISPYSRGYPICAKCTAEPPDIDKAVARAKSSRKRK